MEGDEKMKYKDFCEIIGHLPGDYIVQIGIPMEDGYNLTKNIIVSVPYKHGDYIDPIVLTDLNGDCILEDANVLGFVNVNYFYCDELYCFNDKKYKFEGGVK